MINIQKEEKKIDIYLLGLELFPCDLLSLELPREVPRDPSFFESVSLARSSISLHITSSHSSWSSSLISATNEFKQNENENANNLLIRMLSK